VTYAKNQLCIALRSVGYAAMVTGAILGSAIDARAAIVEHDTLEVGVQPPDDALINREDGLDLTLSDALTYDDNIYRLSPNVTNLLVLPGIGPNPRRQDYIDTASADVNGQYSIGRQLLVGDFRVDDNLYDYNKNLDNVSTGDKVAWYWNAVGVLTGQVGADYYRGLAGFVNASVYARNIITTNDYYVTGRYQVGPKWGLYTGALESSSNLSNSLTQGNDTHTKSVDFGTDYALGQNDILGWEYRYTDARYPTSVALNDDYREENARMYARYELSEKTSFDASAGWLVRHYPDATIQSFSGYIWRIAVRWEPTEKLLLELDGWRNLQAYVTAQSDYFVSNGGTASMQWVPREKLTVTANVSFRAEDYLGTGVESQEVGTARRDTVTSTGALVTYTPLRILILELGVTHETRGSNESQFRYTDNLIKARFAVKFGK
jgi:hypothetical protein